VLQRLESSVAHDNRELRQVNSDAVKQLKLMNEEMLMRTGQCSTMYSALLLIEPSLKTFYSRAKKS